MSRVLLPNYGFEYEISDRALPAPARALEQRFATLLRLVPGWREASVFDGGAVEELLPWGWSSRALALSAGGPAADVVKTVNSKCFSHDIERQLGVLPDSAAVVQSVRETREAVTRRGGPWLLKHPFGVAGRDQVHGVGWDEALERRVAKLFATTADAVLEPRLRIVREFSVHVDCVKPEPRLVSSVGLLTSPSGTFRGNVTGVSVGEDIIGLALDAARFAMDAGYRGPLGIDGFETPDGVRPISEINARWTFGRLAAELAGFLGQNVVWRHGPAAQRPADLKPVAAGATGGAWLLPEWCDPQGVSHTWIELVDRNG